MIDIKTYENFEEVAGEVAAAHPIIYKYRTWENDLHKRIILNHEIWYAHPHDLNDTYDMRPPHLVVTDGIDWGVFRSKLEVVGRHYQGAMSEDEFQAEVDARFQIAQSDPKKYFHNNIKEYQEERSNFDMVGVFSCCTSGINEPMWAHYGANLQGFAVGFSTEEIARHLNSTCGYMHYSDAPVRFHPMEDYAKQVGHTIFQKSARWGVEEEFRFSTAGIGKIRERNATFAPNAVHEILLGPQMNAEAEQQIVDATRQQLPNVSIYKLSRRTEGYGFNRALIPAL